MHVCMFVLCFCFFFFCICDHVSAFFDNAETDKICMSFSLLAPMGECSILFVDMGIM